jgi:hypothetical protein
MAEAELESLRRDLVVALCRLRECLRGSKQLLKKRLLACTSPLVQHEIALRRSVCPIYDAWGGAQRSPHGFHISDIDRHDIIRCIRSRLRCRPCIVLCRSSHQFACTHHKCSCNCGRFVRNNGWWCVAIVFVRLV